MMKKFKKLFKKSILNNERGSALVTAIAVITVLTFSLTTITQVTVNLSGATTLEIEQVNSDSTAKGLISIAINEFEEYIEFTDPGNYTAFDNTEIPRIFADYGVIVTDESAALGYGEEGSSESAAYKFAVELPNDSVIYKLCFVSNVGSELVGFTPFEFSVGTNGTLILNGGRYDVEKIYGHDIWLAGEAPYVRDGYTTQHVTPQSSEEFPVFSNNTPAEIWAYDEYKYCEQDCFTINSSENPFVIRNESNYIDVEGSALQDKGNIISDANIADFFGDFSFEEYLFDFLRDEAPESDATLPSDLVLTMENVEDVITSYSEPIEAKYRWGSFRRWKLDNNSEFIDITGFEAIAPIDFNSIFSRNGNGQKYSLINKGTLTIEDSIIMTVSGGWEGLYTESLINFGDLYLVGTEHGNNNSNMYGKIVVFGDLYITGKSYDIDGTFIVTGQTFVNFDEDEGFTTDNWNQGFTLLSGDNIIIEEHEETHTPADWPPEFRMFLYSEESIYIDVVNSEIVSEGAIFARAAGLHPENQIFMNDESGTPINGIVINSYSGYINTSGVANPLNNVWRYEMDGITAWWYDYVFDNLPPFESVVLTEGEYTFETSEFILE